MLTPSSLACAGPIGAARRAAAVRVDVARRAHRSAKVEVPTSRSFVDDARHATGTRDARRVERATFAGAIVVRDAEAVTCILACVERGVGDGRVGVVRAR